MSINSKTISISPRGQITLPKKLRDLFKTNSITLEIIDNSHAMISPIPDVGGIISGFKKKTDLSFEQVRNKSWANSINNKENL